MDEAGRNTVAFLESRQDAMRQLGEVWNHYQRRGTRPDRPYLVLSGRPVRIHEKSTVREFNGNVAIGLHVRGSDGKEQDVLKSSEIEGELLDQDQVRSSLARRLGVEIGALTSANRAVERVHYQAPQAERLEVERAAFLAWFKSLVHRPRFVITQPNSGPLEIS